MSGRGRPRTDPEKVVNDLYEAIGSVADKGMKAEADAIRYYLRWQGKTRKEVLDIHQKVVAELMKQLEECQDGAGSKSVTDGD